MSKDPLKRLRRECPLEENLGQWIEELKGASDRAVAILATNVLDHLLQKAITKRIGIEDEYLASLLFDDTRGAINSFYGKIQTSYCLGIFGKTTYLGLECVRLVRNTFAHSPMPITFDNPDIIKKCSEIPVMPQLSKFMPALPSDSCRDKYVNFSIRVGAFTWISQFLGNETDWLKPLP
jgi:hypothetical protein